MKNNLWITGLTLAFIGLLYWRLFPIIHPQDSAPPPSHSKFAKNGAEHTSPSEKKRKYKPFPFTDTEWEIQDVTDPEEKANADTIRNETLMTFASKETMEEAIRLAKLNGVSVIGKLDALNAVRFRADSALARNALDDIGNLAEDVGSNYFVRLPTPPPIESAPNTSATGSQGFGPSTMDFLAVPRDNQAFGKGVTVAILDTGIDPNHPAFANTNIRSLSVMENENGFDSAGHGTAVASLIIGTDTNVQGVAPGVDLLSVQVMDANGTSDSFTLASGIVTAVDSGANIISLSLGSYGDSQVLQNAIQYAQSKEVAVVAAAGNDGISQLPYPAQYPEVIGVAAVDATASPAYFSNFGENVDIAAPGIDIYSAGLEDSIVGFSGTSASTPLVSGALAVVMSEQSYLGTQGAVDRLLDHTNDAGAPGTDPHFGTGILNVQRPREDHQSQVYDLAVADYYLDPTSTDSNAISMKITVQNRGTEYLSSIRLDYSLEGRQQTAFLGNLNPNEVKFHEVLLNPVHIIDGPGTAVESRVSFSGNPNAQDSIPENDTRAALIRLTTPE